MIKKILELGILSEEAQRNNEHVASGKLSASSLGLPTQWQILKYLGVEPKPRDAYDLLVFRRGRDVEDFLVGMLQKHSGKKIETQMECKYRDCIGYLDLMLDGIPVEVKSTNSMAYKHILKEGQAKKGHALQAAYYSLALGLDIFKICYINADTYQTIDFDYKTKHFTKEIDGIIDNFDNLVAGKKIPVFSALEKWNTLPKYMQYPEHEKMGEHELGQLAKKLYRGEK